MDWFPAAWLFCLTLAPVAAGQPLSAPDQEPGRPQATGQQQAADPESQSPAPQQEEPAQPPQPEQRPLNPTQEIAGQEPEGRALDIGPAKLRIGGYLGLTGIHRSTNSGGGTGTNFDSIPYEDTVQGNVSETRLSAESSRLSIRVDASFADAHTRFRALSGYFEMDFSGTRPGDVAVTSSSAGFRLRHAFAEVQYHDSFFLAVGQAFSLMTPAKAQVSIWPSDVEMSQAVDTNYLAGMVWARIPQLRVTWRPSKTLNWAASLENPEQQIGDEIVRLPDCCASDIAAQYNTGSDQLGVPNLMPDVVTRVAFNQKAFHVDAGGVLRVFRHTVEPYDDSFKKIGGGGSVNLRFNAGTGTKLLLQSALGSGLGRYIGGLVPDVVFRSDGSISPLRTASWVAGAEQRISPRAAVGGYYSGVKVDDNFAPDDDGSYIGYGFPGSARSNNRRIRELTGTFSMLVTKTENRGSVQLGLQTSWLTREPWFRGSAPGSANAFLFFAQARYNLP